MKKSLNFRYTIQQIVYWAAAAGVVSFASAFLLAKGFRASQVGIFLACGNLLSCTLQPVLADRADRSGPQLIRGYILGLTAVCLGSFLTIQLLPIPKWLFGALYIIAVFSFDSMVPMYNALCVAYNRSSYRVNYGLGRGIGSFAFSLASLGIGKVMASFGADWMAWIVIVLLSANLVLCLAYPRLSHSASAVGRAADCCSIPVFFSRYRWYCVSLLGVMLLAMYHSMTENYLIKVMERLGGDSSSVGIALFIATAIEMPVVVYLEKIRKYLRDNLLFKLAGLSFILRSVFMILATNVTTVYFIHILQATSYSFLAPVSVFYANNKVCQADMVKGQAFITAAYTLGSAIGNFTGGQLLDLSGVMALLIAGIGMATAGTVIMFLTVEKYDKAIIEEKALAL